MESFGNIIKREREKRCWLLRQAAARLEIDQALISKYEKGDRRPTRDQVEKFASIYNLNYDELMVSWLSDKIAYDLSDESNPEEILRVAEKKIIYNNNKNQ